MEQNSTVPAVILYCALTWCFCAAPPAQPSDGSFRRGDANQDATIDVSDVVCVLEFLFEGVGPCSETSCADAFDVNDSEEIDLSDPIYLLGHLYLGRREPPSPHAYCGKDVSRGQEQLLDCDSYGPCVQVDLDTFSSPETCAPCHPRQYREWSGSMHSYSGQSPLFNALEVASNMFSDNSLRPGGASELFCIKCHNAVGTALGDTPSPARDGSILPPSDHMSALSGRGVQCDTCHFVRGSHTAATRFQQEADGVAPGISNAAFRLEPGPVRFGPLANAVATRAHQSAPSENGLHSDSRFCGMCHDVRLPGHNETNGEPFLRLENLFTEWKDGPYNDPQDGRNIFGQTSCQDCHMSLFPWSVPGNFASGRVAETSDEGVPPLRSRVSTHFFTAVDKALIPFPNQFGDDVDEQGFPSTQDARRRRYLELAATMSLEQTPKSLRVPDGATEVFPVRVTLKNFFTGHNLPAGFSQERQVWVELEVRDGADQLVYRSGHLEDRPHPETGEMEPDGRLGDEDHLDKSLVFDLSTGEATTVYGEDRNQRPARERGLVSLQNRFLRRDDGGTPDDDSDDSEEEVYLPFLANKIDNDVALGPLEERTYTYDVDVSSGLVGPLRIRGRLLFRQFPPYFVRFLAGVVPDLVSEETVDRLDIVEMTTAELMVTLNGVAEPEPACVDYESEIQAIWDRKCLPCHAGQGAFVELDLSRGASYAGLVGVPSRLQPDELRVRPGVPQPGPGGSFLLDKLMGHTPSAGMEMPAGEALLLSEREVLTIWTWIEEGAPRQAVEECAAD